MRYFLLLLSFALSVSIVRSASIMAIDFGSEFMKIAIVKPGVPMEIALNKETKRKTPTAVAILNGERFFGDSALSKLHKSPSSVFSFLSQIIGLRLSNPQVASYKQKFPHHHLVEMPTTELLAFQNEMGLTFTVEELTAMVFEHAKSLASDFADQTIRDTVITVPAFYTQAQRRAVLRAADLAELTVLQIMNDNAAVALNYGAFRRKAFNTTPVYFLFYDMGSSTTTVTIAQYQLAKIREGERMVEHPQVTIRGVGYDSHLGGFDMDLRLRNKIAELFKAKTKLDVSQNKRALTKMLKEAGRVKKVLSANTETFIQIESLHNDIDFSHKFTRVEFEELCSDLFRRVEKPVKDALFSAQVQLDDIEEVILMGGGTRVPKVQEILKQATNRQELGKGINADEAAALGAVYQAAYHTKGFRVKTFVVKDGNLFPIQVEFNRQGDNIDDQHRKVKRLVFTYMGAFPSRKIMTFSKHTNDFQFNVSYGSNPAFSDEQMEIVDSKLLATVDLNGVTDAFEKHKTAAQSKGVKAHFNMDDSGILKVENVEFVFEKAPGNETEDEESTLSKLGSKISSFFGGSSEKEGEKDSKKDKDTKDTKKEDTKKPDDKTKKTNATEEVKNATNATQNATEAAKKKTPPKPVTIREAITIKLSQQDFRDPIDTEVKLSKTKILDLRAKDQAKTAREHARHDIESFIFETRDKMYQDVYEKSSTQTEKDSIQTALSEASDWLDEQPESTEPFIFETRLASLKTMTKDLFARVHEHTQRPKVIADMRQMLNYSEGFLFSLANISVTAPDLYTKVELETLGKVINDTHKWLNDSIKAQETEPWTSKPKLALDDLADKMRAVDREVKYLLNKLKTYRPKPKPEPSANDTITNATNKTETFDPDKNKTETVTPPPETPNPEVTLEDTSSQAGAEQPVVDVTEETLDKEPKPDKPDGHPDEL